MSAPATEAPTRAPNAPPHRPGSMRYQPSLDGIRALAVAAVLVYHGGFVEAQGGFLGVSIFFTLSGFLITSLLIGEQTERGRISLSGFWGRRFRRLLPASWMTVGLVVLAGAFGWWTNSQMRGLLGDVPAALAQVFNWRLIAAGTSYGAQFAAPSPLEHYWSLAIEEQFYVLFPLLVAGCGLLARKRGWSLRATVGAMSGLVVVGSVTATLIVGPSGSRAYLGTDTRAAELAVGALLAVAWFGREPIRRFWHRTWVQVAGLVAIGFWVWSWRSVVVSAHWLFPWGLLLTAVATSAVILAALQRDWLSSALGCAPLRALGRISYGVYLLHWPIGRLITPARTGLGPWPLFFLQTAVSVAAATLSFHFVEMPIRRGRKIGFPRAALVGVVAAALLLAGNVVVNDVPAQASAITRHAAATKPAPKRILLIGDQLATSLAPGLKALPKDGFDTLDASATDCGLTLGGWVQLVDGRVELDSDRCGGVPNLWSAAEGQFRPDLVVVWGGQRDVANRRLGLDIPWLSPPDPQLDQFFEAGLQQRLASFAAAGAKVVVLTMPVASSDAPPGPLPPQPGASTPDQIAVMNSTKVALEDAKNGAPTPTPADTDPARVAYFNTKLAAAAKAAHVSVMDAAADVTAHGGTVSSTGVDPTTAAALVAKIEHVARSAKREKPPVTKISNRNEALPVAPPASPRRTPGQDIRVTVVGDSVGIGIANGLQDYSQTHAMKVSDKSALGCPIARGGLYRANEDILTFPTRCSWGEPNGFPAALTDTSPDVVVVVDGAWEVLDRLPEGATVWEHLGEPSADRFLMAEMLRAIDLLGSEGARVVVLTSAYVNHRDAQGFIVKHDSSRSRMDRFNEIVRQAVAKRPGVASVIEFGAFAHSQPGGEFNPTIRADGVHFTAEFGPAIGNFLGPQIDQLEGRPAGQ